jgi:hypothetical protein
VEDIQKSILSFPDAYADLHSILFGTGMPKDVLFIKLMVRFGSLSRKLFSNGLPRRMQVHNQDGSTRLEHWATAPTAF